MKRSDVGLVISIINVLVVLLVGVILFLVTVNTNGLTRDQVNVQKRNACDDAAFQAFPGALSDPAELVKAVSYRNRCYSLNGVNPRVVTLPSTTTTP